MNDVVWSLGAISDLWLDPQNRLCKETIQALTVSTGFNRSQIDLAINNCFSELSAPKITSYMTSFTVRKRRILNVLYVLPSNAFTAWVHGAVTTLLLGHNLFLKPSIHEPVFAHAWRRSVHDIDPRLAAKVHIVDWDVKHLSDYQAVVAYGSDETLAEIRSKLQPQTIFVGYGHKLSVGIIFQEALGNGLSDELFNLVCQDADPFRLQGCLSPQILYLEGSIVTRWPALEVSLDVAPKIRAVSSWTEILKEIEKLKPYLSSVGFSGHPNRAQFLERELREIGVSRICPLGEMQRPPLSWRNGGLSLPDLLH